MEKLTEQMLLQAHKAELDNFLESNKASVVFSKMALWSTLLINGAAIIPIVYAKTEYLYPCAVIFGWGALFSVIATFSVYWAQRYASAAWATAFRVSASDAASYTEARAEKVLNNRKSSCFRLVAAFLVVLSLGCFVFGLWKAGQITEKREMHKSTQQKTPQLQYQVDALSLLLSCRVRWFGRVV